MTIGTLTVGGHKFKVIPEAEFRVLCRQAKAGKTKSAGTSSRRPPKTRSGRKTLKQMNGWMSRHWDEVMAKAKKNTKRLTGREVL
jgi:hypothetical protein